MSLRFLKHCRFLAAVAVASLLSTACAAEQPTTRPALDELNREIKSLYGQVGGSFLRAQLPPPRWANEYALEPINKYQKLNPEVRQRISEQQRGPNQIQGNSTTARIYPDGSYDVTSKSFVYSNYSGNNAPPPPATQANAAPTTQQGNTIVVGPPGDDQNNNPGGPLQINPAAADDFAPTQVGLLLDDKGNVLIPIFVERETCEKQPVRLAGGDGKVVAAKFIGSDRQTNLSIVQVAPGPAKPLPLGSRPSDGSVCLFISPLDGSGRLGVWAGGARDFGYVLTVDGHVAGLARYGQLLSGAACGLIAEQIEKFGAVRRPKLGVVVREIRQEDRQRGLRTQMRIDGVLPGSVADRAGLKAGDLILKLNDEPANDIPSLAAAMTARAGKTSILILRGADELPLTLDLPDADAPPAP